MDKKLQQLYLKLVENDLASIRMCRELMLKIMQKLLDKKYLTIEDFEEHDLVALKKLQEIAIKQIELRDLIDEMSKTKI